MFSISDIKMKTASKLNIVVTLSVSFWSCTYGLPSLFDETGTTNRTICSEDQFQCKDGSSCIHSSQVCDNNINCVDRSDESACDECKIGKHFVCRLDKMCIPLKHRCDGHFECADNSDEMSCLDMCPPLHTQCQSGDCLYSSKFCDGNKDCADGSDEEGCDRRKNVSKRSHRGGNLGHCTPNEFQCKCGACIEGTKKCDKNPDCEDVTDEIGCGYLLPVNVSISPPNSVASKGAEVIIRCQDVGPYRLPVKWTKSYKKPTRGLVEMVNGVTSLRISQLAQNDEGSYECSVEDHLRSQTFGKSVETTHLRVSGDCSKFGPTISVQPKNQTLPVKATGTFRCSEISSTGDVTYNVIWTKDGGLLSPRAWQASGVLTVSDITKEDRGAYVCTGSNHQSDTAMLTVDCSDDGWLHPRFRFEPRYQKVQKGSTVWFNCQASGTPISQVKWSFSGGDLPREYHLVGGLMTLPDVNEGNEGTYSCNASNVHGSAQSHGTLAIEADTIPTARIEPQNPAIVQGKSETLWCVTTGDPPPSVTWSKDGVQLPSRYNAMTIGKANVQDKGLYACNATNRAGSGVGTTFVEIEPRQVPVIEIYPKATQVVKGEGSQFQCKVLNGLPFPTLSWTRDGGRPLVKESTQVLEEGFIRFSRTTGDEDGIYICTAENIAGHVTAPAVLKVQMHIKVNVVIYPQNGKSRECEDVVISCRDEGPSRLPVKWSRPDRRPLRGEVDTVDGMSRLHISKSTLLDEGAYTCSIEGHHRSDTTGNYDQKIDLWLQPASMECLLERLQTVTKRLTINESVTCVENQKHKFRSIVELLEGYASNYGNKSDENCLFLA